MTKQNLLFNATSFLTKPLTKKMNKTNEERKEKKQSAEDVEKVEVKTHPDGGYGWVVVAAAFMSNFIIIGMMHQSVGIFYAALVDTYPTINLGVTAWVPSIGAGFLYVAGPLSTSLCERFGCRKVAIAGSLFCVTGLVITSFVHNIFAMYFTYGVLWGIGGSMSYFPAILIPVKYFKKRLATATGIVFAGGATGSLIMAPVLQYFFSTFGFHQTLRIEAALHAVVLISGLLYKPVAPEYLHLQNMAGKKTKRRFFDWTIFKTKIYLVYILALSIFMTGYCIPKIHLIRYAVDVGIEQTRAAFLSGVISIGSLFGRLLTGKLCDYPWVNRLYFQQIGFLLMSVTVTMVPTVVDYPSLVALTTFNGVADGIYMVLLPVMCLELVGPKKMAHAYGMSYFLMSIPRCIGPPIAGWMCEAAQSYDIPFFVAGLTITIGALIMFLIPWLVLKKKKKEDLLEENPVLTATEGSLTSYSLSSKITDV